MTNQNNIDVSLLDLFRIELESNSRILEKGLIDIENHSSSENFEPLMRAAHSIKGAARIVGLNIAVELSHSMEDILEKALKGTYKLNAKDIENLLDANDIYIDLLKFDYTEIPERLNYNAIKIKDVITNLKNPTACDSVTTPPKEHSNGSSGKKNDITKVDQNGKIIKSDDFMIDLFLKELKSDSELLKQKIQSYKSNTDKNEFNEILRVIHSLKGASRIIKLEPLNILTTKIEEILIEIQSNNGEINFSLDFVSNLISNAQECNCDNLYEYFYAKIPDINNYIDKFNQSSFNQESVSEKINDFTKTHVDITPDVTKTLPVEQVLTQHSQKKPDERFVRVFSESLNRILGLSGEVLVQTRLIKPFLTDLQKIKREFLEINSLKEAIYQDLFEYELSDEIKSKFAESSDLLDKILSMLITYNQSFENFSRRVEITADKLYNEAINTRMKAFSEGLTGFQRMVRDISKKLNKKVELVIKGENTKVDKDILEKLESPLNHLVSNAIDHAIEFPNDRIAKGKLEFGKVTLEAKHTSGMLIISVSDDGKGIDREELKTKIVERGFTSKDIAQTLSNNELYDFLFLPGFSTAGNITEISGRGVGLDIVFSSVNDIGGVIKVESEHQVGTTFTMQLPLTLSVIRSLLVSVGGQTYAFPISRIERALSINANDLLTIENNQYIIYEKENVGIINAKQLFGIDLPLNNSDNYNIVIISDRLNRYGVVVDDFISQIDLVLLPLDKKLGRIPNISNGAILDDGSPTLVLDVDDMVRSIDSILKSGSVKKISYKAVENISKSKKILVVEDSLTVREVEKKLLENKGYHVTVAVDGIDGWNVLHRGDEFDLIISDIDMPRMNGIDLVKRIRSDENLREVPVMIVSYKDREEDKLKGLEAGANYYLAKSSFHDDTLIDAVIDLIGAA